MRTREIICEYQPYILRPPVHSGNLYKAAASNDDVTIARWKEQWLSNIRANHKKFGSFKDKSLGNLFGKYRYRPVIVAGSGPSLKYNVDDLKNKGEIPLVSCLHNFHFFEDRDVKADYYVTLDAGPITIEELSEGGSKTEDEYWEITKDRTLIAFIGTDPGLLEKWQGQIYFYNAPVPEEDYRNQVDAIEPFHINISNGGNVLGASMYISKAFFGCGATIFIGADFSFGYDRKFHSWESKYDEKMGQCVPVFDVFGNKVLTWQSYSNFKSWFEWVSLNVPGIYINCTEGGSLGSYADGNLISIKQMDLKDCLSMYNMCDHVRPNSMNPALEGDDAKRVLF